MAFPILVSYAYARNEKERFEQMANDDRVQLLLDCGAFTAKNCGKEIKLSDYCTFLDTWKHRLFRYLALDVVGDPKATNQNLKEMIRSGYSPSPVHVLGDDQRRMDELFEMSDYVALAGLRRPQKGAASKEYVAAKMKWAAGRNVHWLGYVREPMIAAFKPYSCDSASWASAGLYGVMSVYLGKGRWESYQYKEIHKLMQSRRSMNIIKKAGYSIRDIKDPNCWRRARKQGYSDERFMSMNITCASWMEYVRDINALYGTRIFLATGLIEHDFYCINKGLSKYGQGNDLDNDTVPRVSQMARSSG